MKRTILYIVSQLILLNGLIWSLSSFLPDKPMNWAIEIGWASMLVTPLVLSVRHWLKTGDRHPMLAMFLAVYAYGTTLVAHFNPSGDFIGLFLPSPILLYGVTALLCYFPLGQKWMGVLSGVVAVFGAAIIPKFGLAIETAESTEAYWYCFTWSALVAAMVQPTALKIVGTYHGTPKSRPVIELQKAA